MPIFVAFANYSGGNTPNTDGSKLPTAHKISEYIVTGPQNSFL